MERTTWQNKPPLFHASKSAGNLVSTQPKVRGYLSEEGKPQFVGDPTGRRPAHIGRARALRETPRALYVGFDNGGHLWIPQSVIHDESEVYRLHDHGDIVVFEWFARKNCPNRF